MKSWVGNLLSRKRLESNLDSFWNRTSSDSFRRSGCGTVKDVWDADYINGMEGPDGSKPFCQVPQNETRLLFTMSVDWFNPHGNKVSGKHRSLGAIYMVCLNLPPAERYKQENIYLVGIIPNPNEPSLDEINHCLQPIVDELLQFWSPGIWYTTTASHPKGRLVRCALITLVCDLPALRKVAGFTAAKHTFCCSVCYQQIRDISNIEIDSVRLRDRSSHLANAKRWRACTSQKEREDLLREGGVRWSELNRLPYWDPIKNCTIDAMHLLFLGLIQRHFRKVWHVDQPSAKKNDKPRNDNQTATDFVSQELMGEGRRVWCEGTDKALSRLRLNVLHALHLENDVGLPSTHSRVAYAESLMVRLSSTHEYKALTDKKAHRKALIPQRRMIYPRGRRSRITAATSHHGTQSTRGNLSGPTLTPSAQIHQESKIDPSKCTGYAIPVTKKNRQHCFLSQDELSAIKKDILETKCPSWFQPAPVEFGEAKFGKLIADQWRSLCTVHAPITLLRLWFNNSDRRIHLKNFVFLIVAVQAATARSTSPGLIDTYDASIKAYLKTLLGLHSDYQLSPNQHLALHLGKYLRLFGPAHGHWAFPFERLNGAFQKVPTNSRFGNVFKIQCPFLLNTVLDDIPKTYFRFFTKLAYLRSVWEELSSRMLIVTPVMKILNKFLGEYDKRNTHVPDLLSTFSTRAVALEKADLCHALPYEAIEAIARFLKQSPKEPPKFEALRTISLNGYDYQPNSISIGNSLVGFTTVSATTGTSLRQVGEIEHLISVASHDEPGKPQFLALVKRYLPPPPSVPVEKLKQFLHPLLRLNVVSTSLETGYTVIPVSGIGAHIARCTIKEGDDIQYYMTIGLDRVWLLLKCLIRI